MPLTCRSPPATMRMPSGCEDSIVGAMSSERREFGYVYRRGPVWWVRYAVDGKRHYESSGSTSRREAEKLLARRQAELGLGRFVEPDVRRTTFEHLAEMLLDDYRVNGRRSLARVRTSLRHLRAFFGGAKATRVTTDRINAYIRERQAEGAAPSSIQKELSALRRGFRLALRAGKVANVPHIPHVEVNNVRVGFFEEAEFRAMLVELPEDVAPLIEFAYLTGWRVRSEVLPLTWRQVDFRARVVRLEPGTTKNREGRTFPFGALPRLEAVLREQRAHTDAVERATDKIIPCVFHRDGEPIRDFRSAWKNACKRAGVLGMVPHDLRRTAVRNLERACVPRSVAMKLTGHKTEAVYRRYAIVAEADLREGVEKLARLHDGGAREERTALPFPRRVTKGGQSGDDARRIVGGSGAEPRG